jgi:hypothetical protein
MNVAFRWIALACVCSTIAAAMLAHAWITKPEPMPAPAPPPRYGFETVQMGLATVVVRTDLETGHVERVWPNYAEDEPKPMPSGYASTVPGKPLK